MTRSRSTKPNLGKCICGQRLVRPKGAKPRSKPVCPSLGDLDAYEKQRDRYKHRRAFQS